MQLLYVLTSFLNRGSLIVTILLYQKSTVINDFSQLLYFFKYPHLVVVSFLLYSYYFPTYFAFAAAFSLYSFNHLSKFPLS